MKLDWRNFEDIALGLLENHPEVDPLTVRFTDLHRWVMELDDFVGKADGSSEGLLEQIQLAWHEEFQDQ